MIISPHSAFSSLQLQMLCGIFPRHIIEFLSMKDLASVPENYGALARSHQVCMSEGYVSRSSRGLGGFLGVMGASWVRY